MSDIPRGEAPPEELDLEGEEDGIDDGAAVEDQGTGEDGEGAGDQADAEESADLEDGVAAQPQRARRLSQSERLRDRLERTERELAEARGFQRAAEQFRPQQQMGPSPAELAEQQRQEAERLALMSPQEVAAHYYQKGQQEFQRALLMQQLASEDRLDKREYDGQARTSRIHQQYRDRVEAELARERNAGNLRANRDDILARLVGRDAMDRATQAAPRQRQAAANRQRQQQARPTNGRGDAANNGARRGTWGDPEFDARMAAEALRKGIF